MKKITAIILAAMLLASMTAQVSALSDLAKLPTVIFAGSIEEYTAAQRQQQLEEAARNEMYGTQDTQTTTPTTPIPEPTPVVKNEETIGVPADKVPYTGSLLLWMRRT